DLKRSCFLRLLHRPAVLSSVACVTTLCEPIGIPAICPARGILAYAPVAETLSATRCNSCRPSAGRLAFCTRRQFSKGPGRLAHRAYGRPIEAGRLALAGWIGMAATWQQFSRHGAR